MFDEFTSVVDRKIAKVSAYAMAKVARRTSKQFIAVTCHYDVLDWLEPDWVFCTDDMLFTKKRRRSPIKLKVHRCKRSLWQLFSHYHYLNTKLPAICQTYVACIDAKPVAFLAVKKVKMRVQYCAVSRLVVIPDYQGHRDR